MVMAVLQKMISLYDFDMIIILYWIHWLILYLLRSIFFIWNIVGRMMLAILLWNDYYFVLLSIWLWTYYYHLSSPLIDSLLTIKNYLLSICFIIHSCCIHFHCLIISAIFFILIDKAKSKCFTRWFYMLMFPHRYLIKLVFSFCKHFIGLGR